MNYKNNTQQQQTSSYVKPKLSLGVSYKDNSNMNIYNTKNNVITRTDKNNNEIDLVTVSKTLPKSVKPLQQKGLNEGKSMKETISIVSSNRNQSTITGNSRYLSNVNNGYNRQSTNQGYVNGYIQGQVNPYPQNYNYHTINQSQSSQSIGPIMNYVRSGNNNNNINPNISQQSIVFPYSQNTYSNNTKMTIPQVNNQIIYSQSTVQQGGDMTRSRINQPNQPSQYHPSTKNLLQESFSSEKDDVIISSVSTLSLKSSSSNVNKYSQNTVKSIKNDYKHNQFNQYSQMTYTPNQVNHQLPSQFTVNPYSQMTINTSFPQQRETFTPLHQSQFSQKTINTLNSSFSQVEKEKIDVQLNIEDLLLQEEKLSDVIQDLNSDVESSNSCYEWWSFFISSSSLAGNYEIFFKDETSKQVIKEHMLLEFISVMLCYDCENHNLTKKMENKFRLVFYYVHQSMLLFSDYLLSKISSTCMNNIWVSKLKQLVVKHLKLIPTNKMENVRVIKYHNDNIILSLREVLNNHTGKESYLDTLFGYVSNLSTCSLIILSDIFRNRIIKFKNSKGSVLASSLPIEEISERKKLSCKAIPSQQRVSSLTDNSQISNHNHIPKAKSVLSNKSIEKFSTWKTTGGFSPTTKPLNEEPEFNPSMARYMSKNQTLDSKKVQPLVVSTESGLKDIKEEEEKKEIDGNSNVNSPSGSGSRLTLDDKGKTDVVDVLVEAPYIKNNELKKKYCLVLDLDETLIHYKVDPSNSDDGDMLIRPYMFEFLNSLEKYYELILFTAGTEEYGDALANGIEEEKKYFSFKFFRQHAVVEGEDFIKDLSRIGRPLDKTLIVDNMAVNFRSQKENGVLIKPYYGNYKTDKALFYLSEILLKIAEDKEIVDIRNGLKKYKEDIIKNVTSARGWY